MTDQELDAETRAALADTDLEGSDDPEVIELVEHIEVTREEMTGTVEEIGDRLDPRNIVEGAKESVRAATVGKVEDMANSAGAMVGEAGDTVREAGNGIVETITKNPVPAAMVGLGLGWLMMNRQSKPSWQRHATGGQYQTPGAYQANGSSTSIVDQAGQKAGQMADQVHSTVGAAADQVGTTVGHVGSTVGQAADQVGQMASQVPYRVETTARQIGDQAGRLFQQSPLAVGAIAVAVGAAVGLALPVTETERRAIQEPARQALAKVEDAATGALGQVEQKAQDAEEQALDEERQAKPH